MVLWSLGQSYETTRKASQTVTEDLLTALQVRNTAAFRGCFWWPLRFLLTSKRVDILYSSLDSFLGAVEDFSKPEPHEDGRFGVRSMKSLVSFQRGRLGVSIKLWGDKVIGVSVNAPVAMGLTPKWEAPGYVDEESFTEQEISFQPYWLWPSVKATLNVPKRTGRKPAVLLLPGSGMLDRDASIGAT